MLADSGHRVHRRFGDNLDGDGDVNVPQAHRLVVRRSEETAVLVDKGDSVDLSGHPMSALALSAEERASEKETHRTQVLIVLLHNLARPHVVLNDLLVRHSREEDVLVVGVKLDTVGDLAVREGLLAGACYDRRGISAVAHHAQKTKRAKRTSLGIPKLHLTIERRGKELSSSRVKVHVVHGLGVTHEGTQTFTLAVDVPEL